jgi:hypothetical protein
MQDIADPATALNINLNRLDCPAAEKYKSIVNQSVAKSTRQKYSSGLQAFACFEADNRTSHDYPLSQATCRHFAIWCASVRKLKPSSIRTYLAALKFAHTIKGLSSTHLKSNPILAMIIKGITHDSLLLQK